VLNTEHLFSGSFLDLQHQQKEENVHPYDKDYIGQGFTEFKGILLNQFTYQA